MRRRMAAALLCALWILGLTGPFPTNALASVADSGICGAEGDGSNVAWTLDDDGTLSLDGYGAMGYPTGLCYGLETQGVTAEHTLGGNWQSEGKSLRTSSSALDAGRDTVQYHYDYTLTSSVNFTLSFHWANFAQYPRVDRLQVYVDNQEKVNASWEGEYASYFFDGKRYKSQPQGSYRQELPAGNHTLSLLYTRSNQRIDGYYNWGDFYGTYGYCSISGFRAVVENMPWTAKKEQIKRVIISPGVTDIRDEAFSGCSELTEIVIPASVASIGDSAFSGCANLRDVRYLGAEAQWEAVTKGAGNDALNAAALHYGVEGTCGDNLAWTLSGGRLTVTGEGDMPDWDGAESVPPWSFYRSGIESVVLRRGVGGIGNRAFAGCPNLRLASIPSGAARIGGGAFADCPALESVSMPDGLLSVGEGAFEGCAKLKLAVLPGSVSSIGARAFANCASLESLNFPGAASRVADGAFSGCAALSSATISEGVSEIGDNAFSGCAALSVLTLPPGLRSIGASAFSNCAALAELALPDGLERIGRGAFQNCAALAALQIPASVRTIEASLCAGCAALSEAILPDGIESIGPSAFSGCVSLTALQIPASVRTIEASLCAGCAALSEVSIPAGVASVEPSAFAGCAALTNFKVLDGNSVYAPGDGALFSLDRSTLILCPPGQSGAYAVPAGVAEIAPDAFANCAALTALNLPDTVERIGDGAFRDCAALSDIRYIGTEVDWISIEVGADNAPFLSANLRYAYLVQFAPNGGSVGEQSRAVVNGAPYGELPAPQRSGCAFDGWFTAAVGGEPVAADTVAELSGSQTLFAHWTATNVPELSDGDNEVTDFEQAQAAENLEGLLTVPDAETPDVFATALAFCAVYDRHGMMVSLQTWDVDVSDVRNIRFMGRVSVPEGVSVGEIKVMVLSDGLLPLQEAGVF